ncbi:Acyl-CoA dehydrogenase family member 11 [Colletotrichum sp. SAR 10_99]|nr:Acyl-CoA dehydrogenase family member 11 [Colletotrichum sp. SAR 10_99]
MKPSSSNTGFFQELPVLPNQFFDDASFQRALRLFVPKDVVSGVEVEIAQLGEDVLSDQVFEWVTESEHNKPYLKGNGRDSFGRPKTELVVGEGWRGLQNFGIAKGIVATGYDISLGSSARVIQFLRIHLWSPSASNVTCPSAMQDGAARLLQLHLANGDLDPTQRKVLDNALQHLLSRDPAKAWTSGQWMTERIGGSDVSLTETVATYDPSAQAGLANAEENVPLGPWSISGFKWFSSATDSAMSVLLARTQNGISAFYAPMRRHDPSAKTMIGKSKGTGGMELNGVRIQRLKNKFGTQSLPTAELELEGMRGWLLGKEGRGINEISTILTLTRIHSAVGAVSYVGRGLAIARAYAKVRQVGAGRGKRMLLAESPLHMQTLADMTAEYHGLMLLTFFTSYLLGLDEHPQANKSGLPPALASITPDQKHIAPLLRVLTPLCKAYVCKKSIPLLYSCMEALGGVGYLVNEETEYLNISRIYRDCCVLSIWEGTTDVLATDFLRALKHPKGGQESIDALDALLGSSNNWSQVAEASSSARTPSDSWHSVKTEITRGSQEDLVGDARAILWAVAEALTGVLLHADASRDGSEPAFDILSRYRIRTRGETSVGRAAKASDEPQGSKERLARNHAIVPQYLALYSLNVYIVQVTYHTGGNIDVTADAVKSLSEDDVRILELGSKLEFISWYSYPGCIWVLKFTVLFFYKRLTLGILRRKTLITLFWLCGLSYITLCLTVTLSCQPYSDNWRIRPLPGPECTFRPQNFWMLLWLNILTDAALLSIPIPILWHLRVTLRRKIGVAILLSSGVFVISTAIIRAVSTLTGAPSVININRWGFRELGVGLVTVTLPVLSPIFTRPFWRRGPYIRDYYDRLRNPRSPINNARFGNWLGTMVLRYIDEEEGAVFREPDSAKALEDAGYQEYAQRAGSARKSSNETYELETTSGGTSAKSITGIEPA